VRAQSAITEHIDVAAEQVGEVLPEPDEVQQASSRFHLDQKVDVAPAGHLPLAIDPNTRTFRAP
jgi:hypothetical protein